MNKAAILEIEIEREVKLPCLECFRWWCECRHRGDLPTEPGANLNNILAINQFECFTNYVELAVFADFEELQYTEIEYSGSKESQACCA